MSVFVKMTKQSYEKAMQTISELSASNVILREALERIARDKDTDPDCPCRTCKLSRIARDALDRAGRREGGGEK